MDLLKRRASFKREGLFEGKAYGILGVKAGKMKFLLAIMFGSANNK